MAAILLTFDERQQLIHLRHELAVAAQDLAGRIDADLRAIDQAMGLGQAIDHVGRELVPLQGHDIDAPRPGRAPSQSMNGGTSCSTRLRPPMKL